MNLKEQVKRLKMIMKHDAMITCMYCKQIYLPMSELAECYCPVCYKELIPELKELYSLDENYEEEYLTQEELLRLIEGVEL